MILTAVSARTVLAWTLVGPGIEYQEFHLADPNNVFVTRMDRSNPVCMIDSSLGQGRISGGRETVRNQAARYDDTIGYWHQDWGRRYDVVVAVNGDFFNLTTGVPHGGQVIGGWLVKPFESTSFRWSMQRQAVLNSALHSSVRVTYVSTATSQTIDGINRDRGADELVMYTPQYDRSTNTDGSGTEVLVQLSRPALIVPGADPVHGHITDIRQNQGATPIPFDHVVLSATGEAETTLLNNATAASAVTLSHEGSGVSTWMNTYASVGADVICLTNGIITGGAGPRHPRTAIAYNDDYVFFVVVDGRSTVSVGMDMAELGSFCKNALGATAGINQDGGGSSTMVVNGIVMNDPSDGVERTVANGMMMIAIQPKLQSDAFDSGDSIRTVRQTSTRLGPGTNYAILQSVGGNTGGLIIDHGLRGLFARNSYWWKCDFSGTVGWVPENDIQLVTATSGPVFSAHPDDVSPCNNGDALFTVSVIGTGMLSYQWRRNGVDLVDDGHYVGADGPGLTIHNVQESDEGSYHCVVSDDLGAATSYSTALLPLRPPTVITRQPDSLDWPPVVHGTDASSTVRASGDGDVSYQWQKDGIDLDDDANHTGSTTDTLTIILAGLENEGQYRCRVTAGCGELLSATVNLGVTHPDFDRDGDVDHEDFGHMQFCLSGTSVQPMTDCVDARFDPDGDVDRNDLAIFLQCLGQPEVPHDPDCLD